jgi:hypothetical protein
LIENVAMADGASSVYPDRDGFLIQGGTAANPNVLVKNVAGDSDKGNGRNGFTLVGAGNGTASPIELEQNTAQGNKADGFAFKNGSSNGTGWQLKNNISGGSSGQKNGGCAYSSPSGITNYNATGNKANNVLVPGALNSVFPTGCIN